ncbi:MAG: HAD-IA family hydrolase [Rhodospirillales bacterium]|nr:HAD-IA family hydrolase [Rhodospirillales bacterium]
MADELRTVDLVIFDCDGVIADSEVISATLLVGQLLPYGIRIDADYVFRNFVGKSFPIVADIIGERFGVALPSTFVGDYRAALREAFADSLETTPGFLDVLSQLTCTCCVATSSSAPRVAHTLEAVGLTDHFGADVFTASQVANGKPAPDLFLFAARAMATPPARCLVIEDSVAGIEAGLAAGMNVWRYVGGSHIADVARARDETPAGVTVFDNWDRFFVLAPELRA